MAFPFPNLLRRKTPQPSSASCAQAGAGLSFIERPTFALVKRGLFGASSRSEAVLKPSAFKRQVLPKSVSQPARRQGIKLLDGYAWWAVMKRGQNLDKRRQAVPPHSDRKPQRPNSQERKWVQVKGGQRPSAHKTTRKVVAARKRGREIWRP
jgi:hypothetical protein